MFRESDDRKEGEESCTMNRTGWDKTTSCTAFAYFQRGEAQIEIARKKGHGKGGQERAKRRERGYVG